MFTNEIKLFKLTMISSSASYPFLAAAQWAVYGRIFIGCSITVTIIFTRNILLDPSNAGCKGEIFSLFVMETITENFQIYKYKSKMNKSYLSMQQIYRRTPMPKCDFNKVVKQLYWYRTSAGVFSCSLLPFFRKPFSKNTFVWVTASANSTKLGLWNMRIQLHIKNVNNF